MLQKRETRSCCIDRRHKIYFMTWTVSSDWCISRRIASQIKRFPILFLSLFLFLLLCSVHPKLIPCSHKLCSILSHIFSSEYSPYHPLFESPSSSVSSIRVCFSVSLFIYVPSRTCIILWSYVGFYTKSKCPVDAHRNERVFDVYVWHYGTSHGVNFESLETLNAYSALIFRGVLWAREKKPEGDWKRGRRRGKRPED